MSIQMNVCPDPTHQDGLLPAYTRGATDFLVCPRCGLAFRARFPSEDELTHIYADAYGSNNVFGGMTGQESGAYADDAYSSYILSRFVHPGGRVLDFGAATGGLVARFLAAGVNADGLEYSSSAREWCNQVRGIRLFKAIEDIPPETYDLITMIEVIEHVPDLWSVLSGIRQCLRPGGELFVTTPNRKGLRARLENGNWVEASKGFHLFLFDHHSICHHLRRNGFDDIRHVRFSPIVKRGFSRLIFGRTMQVLGLAGTLCFLARRA